MAQAQAQGTPPAPGARPGPGYGVGPGMMGGCPGFGYGMGGPMMGGGMGGMMGPGMGGMMGPGMMGYHYGYGALGALNLSDTQRKEIGKIADEQQKRQYELMGKGMELHAKLRDLYAQDTWDANAISGVYDQMAKLHGQMVRARVDARNRIFNLLTLDQRKQYRSWGDPLPE
jgi:Spy/CpxP family protein refolding chaperone